MSALRRTRAGDFTLAEAHTLEEIRANPEGYILPLERIMGKVSDHG
jgi:tRNA U55 pseudouridine synthase TruB